MQTDVTPNDNSVPAGSDKMKALARSVASTFAIVSEDQTLSGLAALIPELRHPFDEIGRSLQSNISGLLATISVPYTLAHTSALDRHWQRFSSSQRILSLLLTAEPEETMAALQSRRDRETQAKARSEMDRFLASEEGKSMIVRDILEFLERLRSNDSLAIAANELILQGAVLCWGAFEVFVRDCFIARLNASPALALRLLADPIAKRRFELSKISLETLAAYSFNLSAQMGTLMAEQQDLSDIYSVKAIYLALYPDREKLSDSLSDPDLRILSLRRNLIVHRRGMIDEIYASSTKVSQNVGDRLALIPSDLKTHIKSVLKGATNILEAVSESA